MKFSKPVLERAGFSTLCMQQFAKLSMLRRHAADEESGRRRGGEQGGAVAVLRFS